MGRGQVPQAELSDVPKEFTTEEIERWSTTTETPMGRLKHLGPVAAAVRNAIALGTAIRASTATTSRYGRSGRGSLRGTA